MRVLLTGGGTAGHINPALAIAQTIKQNYPSAELAFVGIATGKEADLVPRAGYPLYFVESMGIRRSLSLSNVKALWLALTSPYSKKTTAVLDSFRPDLVIGTGGYACWPLMAAACRRHIPTALHESNALPGLAVRRLQCKVDRIWVNFERTKSLLKVQNTVLQVGNPLLSSFGTVSTAEAKRRLQIPEGTTVLLSFGGSLGAEELNRAILSMMKEYSSRQPDFLHIHATGKRDYEASKAEFERLGLSSAENCVLLDYIYDMPMQMAAADFIVSRAGAMTLSELSLMKKASILVPSPHVADNHQYLNAKTLYDAGAAGLVEEAYLKEGKLLSEAIRLLENPSERRRMSENICAFANADANRIIWLDIQRLLHETNRKKG